MFKKMIKHLKDCLKKGVDIYMNEKEIKAKTLEISSDLLKSAGNGLCATGHTIARGIHTTIHEIINSISNLIKNAIATKVNCLMTTAILGGVCAACLIKARSFDKALVVE